MGNSPVPGEFPSQRQETRSYDVFFDLRLNERLSKQSWGWWFETLSSPYHDVILMIFLGVPVKQPTLHRLISAAVCRWVTCDRFFLGGKSCALAPCNITPKFSEKKTPVSVRFIIKIQHIYVLHMHDYKKIPSVFWKFCQSEKWRMWRIASKKTNGGRDICLEIVKQPWRIWVNLVETQPQQNTENANLFA